MLSGTPLTEYVWPEAVEPQLSEGMVKEKIDSIKDTIPFELPFERISSGCRAAHLRAENGTAEFA